MAVPILGDRVAHATKARDIVIAPRLPAQPKERKGGNPFVQDADVLVECGAPGCGWHAMGQRAQVKLAIDEHQRQYHSDEIGVLLLNAPRQ